MPALPSVRPSPDSAVVILRIAGRPGPAFQLDPAADNVIGRSASGLVALADRLASRRHSVIAYIPATASWLLRDLDSRNGTWLDGLQVRESVLADGQTIRVGTTELEFRTKMAADLAGTPPEEGRLMRHGPPDELQGTLLKRMAGSSEEARWPMLLYQSGVRLLAATSSWQVVCTTLELATEFTAATRFGWFTLSQSGRPRPVCVVPPGSGLELLLAGTVASEIAFGRGVWMSSGTADVAAMPVCATLHERALLVAAAPPGGLREADFDVLVTLASMAAASLAGRPGYDARGTDPIDGDMPRGIDDGDAEVQGTIALSGADLAALGIGPSGQPAPQVPAGSGSLRLEEWHRALVVEALRRSGGSVPEAATALGISRATLYRKLDAWGLTRDGEGRALT